MKMFFQKRTVRTQFDMCVFILFTMVNMSLKIPKGESKKNTQHNGQQKKENRTNNDLENIHIKLMIE